MTEEEWNELGIPKNALLRTINTDNEEDILSKMVSHPAHYGGEGTYEVINIIEAYGMDFVEGNILKYLLRYKKKNGLECLKKAQWYLERLIKQQEGK
jgi:hypothetical protein